MRVVLLTHYYPPEVGAAQGRIQALARGLAGAGMEVTVHTGFPHYPDGQVLPPHRLRALARERDGDVGIVRTWVLPAPNRGTVRRLTGHATFGAGAVLAAGAAGPADVVLAESPPLFTAGAAVAYARRLGAPLVLNCSDLWPQSAIELGALRGRAPIAAAEALERWCYRHAALVTVPVAGMATAAAARGARVQVVPPAVDAARFAGVPDVAPATGAPLRLLYAGTLGMAQGLATVVEAARRAGPGVVELTIAGDGPDGPALREQAGDLPYVHVVGRVEPAAIPDLYAAHDAAVVPLRDRAVFRDALPTKMFEAMAAGRPVLLPAPAGAATDLLARAGCGVGLAPEDPGALAAAIAAVQADPSRAAAMGAAGRARARAEFDRPAVVARWAALLTEVSRTGRRPSAPAAPGRRPGG